MKEKIRKILYIVFICYIIVIVLFASNSFFSSTKTIKIYSDEKTKNTLATYKEEINKIKDQTCKEEFTNLLNSIKKTNYNDEIKVKKLYNDFLENTFMAYINSIKEACNIEDNDLKDSGINLQALSIITIEETIINKYRFQYEFKIRDRLRDDLEPSIESIQFVVMQSNKIKILKSLLEINRGMV